MLFRDKIGFFFPARSVRLYTHNSSYPAPQKKRVRLYAEAVTQRMGPDKNHDTWRSIDTVTLKGFVSFEFVFKEALPGAESHFTLNYTL